MINKRDRIIVCDVEMTCYPDDKFPEGEKREIIQIGYAFLNPITLQISQPMDIIVRPQRSRISDYCTELTGLDWNTVRRGIPYQDAVKFFMKNAATRSSVWSAWGKDDECFIQMSQEFNAIYPFSDHYINIQELFWIMRNTPTIRPSLKRAAEELGLVFEGRWHNAKDDAYNTACILRELIKRGRN